MPAPWSTSPTRQRKSSAWSGGRGAGQARRRAVSAQLLRHRACFYWSMIFFGNPVSTFRIMLLRLTWRNACTARSPPAPDQRSRDRGDDLAQRHRDLVEIGQQGRASGSSRPPVSAPTRPSPRLRKVPNPCSQTLRLQPAADQGTTIHTIICATVGIVIAPSPRCSPHSGLVPAALMIGSKRFSSFRDSSRTRSGEVGQTWRPARRSAS